MNLLGMKMGVVEKVVAVIVLFTLVMGAFPVSFVAAEEPIVEPIVVLDVCDNIDDLQIEVPEGYYVDGTSCYPDESPEPTFVIEGHKYECIYDSEANEGDGDWNCDTPLSGWTISAQNGDSEPITAVTDAEGHYSLTVTAGEWEVSEVMQDYWEQIYTWQNSESLESYTCNFEFGEIAEVSLLSLDEVSEGEADAYCDFGNLHITSPVIGLKWNDENSNGVQDEGEAGIAGWTIYAETTDLEDDRTAETVTNEDGVYILNLEAGDWTISEESRSGWTLVAVEQDFEMVEGTTCEFSLGLYETKLSVQVSDILEDPEWEEYLPTCSFYNHEEPEPTSSGGGSSSGTRVKNRATPKPLVLGEATSTPSCGMYLQDYMRMGNAASSTQVTKLQVFLNAVGIKVEITGAFDQATDAAVRTFQAQHKAEVLTPWYLAKIVPHENPTGWVYQLTRWKINNIVCPGSEAYPVLN